jgi:hypothetical protein
MSEIHLFKEDLERFKNTKTEKVKFNKINENSFLIANESKREFLIILEAGKISKELPYESYDETFKNKSKEVYLTTVRMDNGVLSFYHSDDYSDLRGIVLRTESIAIDFNKMPFLKESYFTYKGYDIEWTGINYQAVDYFTKKTISLATSAEKVCSDIDEFLIWKNSMSTDPEYYKRLGYEIKVVSSGERYPAFPYTYEVHLNDGSIVEAPMSISHVFDSPEGAVLKACYAIQINILKNKQEIYNV